MNNLNASSKQQLSVKAAQGSLLSFAQLIDPRFQPAWFHEIIAEKLEQALTNTANGDKTRIIITIPPRHGKSTLASTLFPAWALGKYPNINFILSSYGADLSEKMGMKTRDIINQDTYQTTFPNISLRKDVKAKAKWMTTKGGSFTAVGIGGAITGIGGNVILIDDPHKDRAEAESETMREKVYEYYKSTLYTRLEGAGAVIIIMQRWHTDDLVGRLLEEATQDLYADQWEVINFPAIAEEDETKNSALTSSNNIHSPRKEGDPLWEEMFPLSTLHNIRSNVGVYNFASQYQQNPIASELQEFHQTHFRYFEQAHIDELDRHNKLKYFTLVDPAISQRKEADNSVVLTVAKEINGPNIYRVREDAGKFTPAQLVDLIMKHQEDYGGEVWLETVAFQKALKYAIEDEQRKQERYFSVKEVKQGNKEMRIRGLIPLYERGVIFHRHGEADYEKELLTFPGGKHDDRIDCMSFVLQVLEGTNYGKRARQYFPHLARLLPPRNS